MEMNCAADASDGNDDQDDTGGEARAREPTIACQLFRLTAAQRRALLVAGAAAGMSAVFGTPVAATLFGVELLALEFRPRSMVPIGLAAATADGLRMAMASVGLVSPQPLFPVPPHPALVGVALAAWVLTEAVYRTEGAFRLLSGHLHWMWWPLLGGVIIGSAPLSTRARSASATTPSRQKPLEEERRAEKVLTLRRVRADGSGLAYRGTKYARHGRTAAREGSCPD